MLAERVAEAARLGFRRLLVPNGSTARLNGRRPQVTLLEVGNLNEAISSMRRAGLSSIR
jgi:predicted ATP-dependent serine protease